MPNDKTTREYAIIFKRDEAGAVEEQRHVRAESPAQARAKFSALLDLRTVEVSIISCKPVRGTTTHPGDNAAAGAVKSAMSKAVSLADFESERNAEEATDTPPDDLGPIGREGPEKLTREEWAILRECVSLDENDTDNAKRLLKWYGKELLHVLENGWHVWTGTHWDAEEGQHAIERYAHKIVAKIKREAALISVGEDEQELIEIAESIRQETGGDKRRMSQEQKARFEAGAAIAKSLARARSSRYNFGIKTGDRSRTSAMIAQAEPHKSILPDKLDTDDLAINCLNGTIRFMRIEDEQSDPDDPRFYWRAYLHDHNPDDLFTKIAATEYHAGAAAPIFLRDMERFMPDAATREFLQVFMGYVALGVTGEQVYAFFYGDGSNWKSAFLQAIAQALGTYYKPMNYTSVSGNNMPTGDKPSPDWARLSGVRFLTIEEVPRKEPIKEELVKLVTSGTPMPVRHLNKGMFDMITRFTCIMTSNAEPNISGHDKGIWRRTLIVPWDVTIPPEERLPFDQVMATYAAERSGILNWIVCGALKYLENGLQSYITDRMRDFTDSVRADRDAAGSFIEDCVQHSDNEHVTTGDLYKAFVKYCKANGIDPIINSTAFGRQVKRVEVGGLTMERRKHKVQGVRRFRDIALHDVPDVDEYGNYSEGYGAYQ